MKNNANNLYKNINGECFFFDFRDKFDSLFTEIRIYFWQLVLALIFISGIVYAVYIYQKYPLSDLNPTQSPATTTQIVQESASTSTPTNKVISDSTLTSTPTLTIIPTALPTEITDAKGVSMILVPAGEFMMGSDNSGADEQPVHTVYLDNFYIDIYEVTNADYKVCVDTGVCDKPKQTKSSTRSFYYGNSQFDEYPVVYVDWNMSKTYCEWRDGNLPTEAQWEKAARGTDGRTYPWGEGGSCSQANNGRTKSCVGDTTEVGSYESGKSPYGIYDLSGNVWEWVADWYDSSYYANSLSLNPLGPSDGIYRVMRGGSWVRNAWGYVVRSTDRSYYYTPKYFNHDVGFRCARNVNP